MTRNIATLIGFCAILQWSSIVGLLKKISLSIGADLAVLFMYSISTILLLILFRIPNLKAIPRTYLYSATLLFAVYEICFSYAIALAQTAQQAIEISLVNYLWPGLTIAFLILFKELKFNFMVVIGLLVSLSGVLYIQSGNTILSWSHVFTNIQTNPLSYFLALMGAVLWAVYCVITKKYSAGHNPIALFFLITSLILWFKIIWLHPEQLHHLPHIDLDIALYMILVSIVTGLGYAAWNIGINRGNIMLLVTLSYFSPIFSSLLSMWILDIPLSKVFWSGATLVTLGSFICWLSTNWTEVMTRLKKIKLKIQHESDFD